MEEGETWGEKKKNENDRKRIARKKKVLKMTRIDVFFIDISFLLTLKSGVGHE